MPSSTIILFSVAPTARMQDWIQKWVKYDIVNVTHMYSCCVLLYLRWVNDCCELLDTEHAQVRDGECPTDKLLRLKFAVSGFCCQLGNWGTNGNQALQFEYICECEYKYIKLISQDWQKVISNGRTTKMHPESYQNSIEWENIIEETAPEYNI